MLRQGILSAKITLPNVTQAGRIVFGRDRAGLQYYSVGIGSESPAYVLDHFESGRGWTILYATGESANLKPNRQYEVVIGIVGQQLLLQLDGVQVFEAVRPAPLQGEGVGVTAWGTSGLVTASAHLPMYVLSPRGLAGACAAHEEPSHQEDHR